VRNVLEIAYGAIITEAFDLGYILSHLNEDGVTPTRGGPEILGELQKHLNDLKFDSKVSNSEMPEELSGIFKKLAARVIAIVARKP
jgi:hypothetical protein